MTNKRLARSTNVCYFGLAMFDSNSKYLGKKYSCPGCHSKLKFRRAPKTLMQTCPNCRRKLRLKEEADAALKDDLIKDAIESLVNWREPEVRKYDYRLDPKLDTVDDSTPNQWIFDQPWPEQVHQVVMKKVEVICTQMDYVRALEARQQLLDGKFRRVTIFRTGQVEQMEVTGHWWDFDARESKMGLLERKVVRELNRLTSVKKFAARINCINLVVRDKRQYLELFIDIAVDDAPAMNLR